MLDLNPKLVVDAAILSQIQARAEKHRFHEQTCLEGTSLLESQALDGFLELRSFDIVAILSQSAIHDGLEYESHLAFESCGIRVEESEVVIKMIILVHQTGIPKVNIKKREDSGQQRD